MGKLIVGINSDDSIRRLKKRDPIFCEIDRSEMVASVVGVKEVIIFPEDTPERCLAHLRMFGKFPAIVVKGADYIGVQLPEQGMLDHLGAKVVYFDSFYEIHTSDIIKKCQASS